MVCFRCTGAALQRHAALRRERTSTLQAMQIHETVSPARWCVNFADLQFLELEVRQAIKDGQMCACDFASSYEDCGQDAELYGPSIYIVNDLYIKPITAAAGKMSWALLMNPKGLDADLFITHAWQEGIFEFIEKVLASWPPRARHAWCCMLANPQNLDIGAMIQSPKVSPFAIALQQSKYMLVVPNRHTSVYTRLWCGYEAYLAFEGQKIIRTARRSILRPVAVAWMLLIPAILLGIACGCLLAPEVNLNIYLAIAAFLASIVTENFDGRCCLIANHLGVFTSVWLVIAWQPPDAWIQLQGLVKGEATMMQRLLWLTATMFFAIAEIDRITFLARDVEGKELRRNFQGSLRFAACSQSRDEEHIRLEIGNKVTQVDQIIQVLIAAGMSSPALRDAALKGVNIDHAGDAAVAIPVLFLGPQLLCGLFQLGRRISLAETRLDAETVCFQAASIAARIGFLILLCRRPIDERYFMMKVMTKLVSALLFPCLVAIVLGASTPTVIRIVFVAFHMSFVLVLFFAVLGIRGALKLPCGKHLVQLFLSRFVWGCFSRPCSCPRPPDEDSEDSSSSSSDSE